MATNYVLIPGTLYAIYVAASSMQPVMKPAGIVRSRELRVLKPKLLMKIGMKVLTGPFAIIIRNAIEKINQNFSSMRSSLTWFSLKWVFRTPELLTRIRETAMYRSRSLKPQARIGSDGMKNKMTNAHRILIEPATIYMYCHGSSPAPLMWPRP